MFWFSTPKKETEQPYVDIESGILPVLSPDDIKRAEHARQQNAAAHQSYPAVFPIMPPTHPTQQKITSNTSQIQQNSNVTDLPLVEATLVPYSPPYSPVIVDCPRATAPPDSFDTSKPILNSAPIAINPQAPRAVHNQSMNHRKVLPRIRMHTRYPILLNPCPLCGSKARTIIVSSPSWITWVLVILLLLFFWPLFWIPLVMDCCKRSRHYCSSCSGEVGEIEALSDCCVNHRR